MTSLWLDEPYAPRPPLRGAASCDVAIVGGGMTGASAAWALADRGLRVALLEGDVVAGRASGRNAGFVLATLAEPYAGVVATRGRATARALWEVQRANRERVAELCAKLALDCGFARTGSFGLAADSAEADALRESAAMLRADGFHRAFLEPGEAVARLGPLAAHGALHGPRDAQIQPARFVRGLAAAAEREGVAVHERTQVERLGREAGAWTLQGDGFALRAGQVLLAANALAPRLHPWFADKLVPVRGQVLATAPLRGVPWPGPVYADHGYDYWRSHDGRLVVGGQRPIARAEEVGVVEALNARVQAALDGLLARLAAGQAPVTHRWAGIMDFSVDGLPLVGPVPGEETLLGAVGFTGHGFGWATVSAEWLAVRVLEGTDLVPGPLRADRALDPRLRPED